MVDADPSKYFDTIPHVELMKCLIRRISDGKMLHLIKMWLKVPIEERDERGNRWMSGGKKSTHGTSAGRGDIATSGEHLHQPFPEGVSQARSR